MKNTLITAATLLACIGTATSAVVFNSFDTYTQDFNSFAGSEGTLPAGFSLGFFSGTDVFRGVFNSTTANFGDFTGVMAATSGSGNSSLAWVERNGTASLNDGRLFLTITNNTGAPITGFNVSYDVQAWGNGRRDNRVRLKYDTFLTPAESGGRETFETDIFSTINPNHTEVAGGSEFVLDGSAIGNFETVSGFVDLTTLEIAEGNPAAGVFGALPDGETAYFRWQISNANLTSGSRSALGIDNLSITPIPEPSTALLGGLGLLALLRRRR